MKVMLPVAVALLIAALPHAHAAVPDDPAVAVRQVVLDIISFTRWPVPLTVLRLCVVGQAVFAAPLLANDAQLGGVPVVSSRKAAADTRLGADCEVVYEAPLAAEERAALLRGVAGFPVLTIGEAAPGCVETTMFCLQAGGAQVPFSTNLDAIARSGVRLNPRVLLLGRRPQGAR
jgi:hypothetical protein